MSRTDEFYDNHFMSKTKAIANESKCAAKKVACLLVKDKSIVSIGINGSLPGNLNCNKLFSKVDGIWYKYNNENKLEKCLDQEEHHKWSKMNEVHAEINALSLAAKSGISTNNCTAYVNYSPCRSCAMSLIQSGINRVVFSNKYDAEDSLDMFKAANIKVDIVY